MVRESQLILQIFFCILPLSLSSCGPALSTPSLTKKLGHEPELKTVTVATVGDPIVQQYDYMAQEGATLTEGYSSAYGIGSISVPQGAFLQKWGKGEDAQWCTIDNRFSGFGGPSIVCFGDANNDGQFDRVRVPPIYFGSWKDREVGPYKKFERAFRGKKEELLYQGLTNNVIKLAYREYQNDLIKPAFQQEVNYTLTRGEPTKIAFKGARITIKSATNSEITFFVDNYFRESADTPSNGS